VIAEEIGIPRSTLQHWLARKQAIDAEPELVAFFESEVGIAFLHRLILAAHFVITLLGTNGVRMVCMFMELSGLDRFVAASYGAQWQVNQAIEGATITFEQEERKRLSVTAKHKATTICEDETFHPEVCLVAIEPVSNFIVLERYATDRKAETWTAALNERLVDLPVEVIQATSDEGRGICRHVEQELGAHHSPDLFHVQQAASQATSAPLAAQVRKAETALAEANQAVERQQAKQQAMLNSNIGCVGETTELDRRIATAQAAARDAQANLESAQTRQTQAKATIRAISHSYHPYDPATGAVRDAKTVAAELETHFATLETVVAEANLSTRCQEQIRKAKRVMVKMLATISFFFLTIQAKVEALSLTAEQEQAVYEQLIPGIYLQSVADKASTAQERQTLHQQSQQLLAPLRSVDSPLFMLDLEQKQLVESLATECAQLFQRSSSCTEGRNGQLALRHHSLHRLSNRKLAALTTVHNYFITRPDGSTPAQRFFNADPRSLFGYLLAHVDLPGRPAQNRPPPLPLPLLI
jgi:hypothetical protein